MFRRVQWNFLKNIRYYYTVQSQLAEKRNVAIAKHLHAKIQFSGPITVSEYMKQILVHPLGGYYMTKDVFGAQGDFVTSPELGQIFGEMISVWLINEWAKAGSPKPLQLIELGPGRGSLTQDILRIFKHFQILNDLSVSLVEISPALSDLQGRKLCPNTNIIHDPNSLVHREGTSFDGVPIKWYRTLQDVPHAFSLIIAHEFFDALPIHKFQKSENGYREILIDIEPNQELKFRFIMAREETPATKIFISPNESREHFEVSPEGVLMIKEIAKRIEEDGGFSLIADYGHNGEGTDSFRAFKKHKLHDPLLDPGTADLTADVDFAALKQAALDQGDVLAFGPTSQRDFLLRMGIEQRIKILQTTVKDEQLENLKGGYHTMIDEDKMGARFKFLAIVPGVLKKLYDKIPIAGFT